MFQIFFHRCASAALGLWAGPCCCPATLPFRPPASARRRRLGFSFLAAPEGRLGFAWAFWGSIAPYPLR